MGTARAERSCGSFVLVVAGELPGEPEVEKSFSLEGVFEWYRDCPFQIERAVIIGGGGEHRANLINKRCEYEQSESL
jgi:hypothetical protein